MPGPARTFGPTQRQASPAREQVAALGPQTTRVLPGATAPQPGAATQRSSGTRLSDYYGGTNAITGQRFGPSRAMPTDPRERAAIEARRRATQAALYGG